MSVFLYYARHCNYMVMVSQITAYYTSLAKHLILDLWHQFEMDLQGPFFSYAGKH